MNKKLKYDFKLSNNRVRIYINDQLHILFDSSLFLGVDSYRDFDGLYGIDITLNGGIMKIKYEDREIWSSILKLIDTNL